MRVAGCWILLCVLTACGGDEPNERANPDFVFRAALSAFGENDLTRLRSLMTERGATAFDRDLRAFQEGLGLEGGAGASVVRAVEAAFPGQADAQIQTARDGSPRDLVALLLVLRPFRVPDTPTFEAQGETRRTYTYQDAQDVVRRVILVKQGETWAVDRLGF